MKWLRCLFGRHDWVVPLNIMEKYPFCRKCGKQW